MSYHHLRVFWGSVGLVTFHACFFFDLFNIFSSTVNVFLGQKHVLLYPFLFSPPVFCFFSCCFLQYIFFNCLYFLQLLMLFYFWAALVLYPFLLLLVVILCALVKVFICVCTCGHTYIYTYIHVFIYTYIGRNHVRLGQGVYMCICVCMYTYIHVYLYICTFVNMYT